MKNLLHLCELEEKRTHFELYHVAAQQNCPIWTRSSVINARKKHGYDFKSHQV